MAIRNIRTIGDPVLNKKCKEVKEMTPRIQELIDDMFDTMYEANGVGLAAPQVGILKRIVVIDTTGEDPIVMINPRIIETSGEQTGGEGCSVHAVRQDHITTILYLLGCIFYAGRKPCCLQRSYIVKKISDKRGFLCSSSKIPAGTSERIPLSGCLVHNLYQSILRMLDSDAIRLMTSDKFCAFYSILRRYA